MSDGAGALEKWQQKGAWESETFSFFIRCHRTALYEDQRLRKDRKQGGRETWERPRKTAKHGGHGHPGQETRGSSVSKGGATGDLRGTCGGLCFHMSVYLCLCVSVCVSTCLCVCLCVSVYFCMYIFICLCVCISMCLCVYMYLCVCVSVCVSECVCVM